MGKAWQWECEAADHLVLEVRKQRDMNAGFLLVCSFLFILDTQSTLRIGLLSLPDLSETPQGLSPGVF